MGTIVGWRRVGVKAIGLTLLAGCSSRQPGFPPADAAQRATVIEAVDKLRDAYNSTGGCEATYSFPSYPKERWLADCAQLQSDTGSWKTFRLQQIEICGMPPTVVCMMGDAAFAKGNRILELAWRLEGGRVQLVSIAWPTDTEWIRIPPWPTRLHLDTPPVPGKMEKRG